LGAGPVQAAHRLPQRGAELGPHPGREVGAVAPARPLLLGPVELDVVDRVAGSWPEVATERLEHLAAALVLRYAAEAAGLPALEEAEEHAGRAVGWGVVEH